jgi:hypothetical protein
MSYCKHQWEDRTQVLREVFAEDSERRTHVFFVCKRCMKINESLAEAEGRSSDEKAAADRRFNAA